MMKKTVIPIYYIFIVVLAASFLGACVPKKMSPTEDDVLHQTTRAALENSATPDDDDNDDDGAWEADSGDQLSRSKHLAKLYSRSNSMATGSTGDLLQKARTALGTPYVRGGTSRGGFDCSGFVQWSYNHVGIQLPRTAREQSQVGKAIRRVDDMQAGDIVAFRHPRRGYHTGIYVGDGKFIHSPRKRNVVRINSLDDPYFNKTFLGARRLNVSNEGDIEAAEKMLAAYASQPPSPKNVVSSSSKNKRKSTKASARNTKSDREVAKKSDRSVKTKTVAAKTDKADRSAKSAKENKADKAGKKTATTASKASTSDKSGAASKAKAAPASKGTSNNKNVGSKPKAKENSSKAVTTKKTS